MTRRWLVRFLALVIIVAALVALRPGSSDSQEAPATGGTGPSLLLPADLAAGEELVVTLAGPAADTIVTVTAHAPLGSVRRVVRATSRETEVAFGPELTGAAGELLVVAATAGGSSSGVTWIHPGPPVDPVGAMVGPRSIVAGSDDTTMVVAIPTDAHGNPAADGTPVELTVRRPGGELVTDTTTTDHLLAWQRIGAGTTAGDSVVAVSTQGASAERAVLREVPAAAASVELLSHDGPLVADGETVHELRTDELVDANGNQLLDGTLVRLRTDGPDGAGELTSTVVGGSAVFRLRAPTRPGPVAARAHVHGATSSPLLLDFGLAVGTLPVEVRPGRALVGPVTTPLGDLVADGTPVRARLLDGTVTIARLDGGWAEIELDDAGLDAVEVLGVRWVGAP